MDAHSVYHASSSAQQDPGVSPTERGVMDSHVEKRGKRRKGAPRPVVNAEVLLRENVFEDLIESVRRTKWKGKGHEKEDLGVLMDRYRKWAENVVPGLTFVEFMLQARNAGTNRAIRARLGQLRLAEFRRKLGDWIPLRERKRLARLQAKKERLKAKREEQENLKENLSENGRVENNVSGEMAFRNGNKEIQHSPNDQAADKDDHERPGVLDTQNVHTSQDRSSEEVVKNGDSEEVDVSLRNEITNSERNDRQSEISRPCPNDDIIDPDAEVAQHSSSGKDIKPKNVDEEDRNQTA